MLGEGSCVFFCRGWSCTASLHRCRLGIVGGPCRIYVKRQLLAVSLEHMPPIYIPPTLSVTSHEKGERDFLKWVLIRSVVASCQRCLLPSSPEGKGAAEPLSR